MAGPPAGPAVNRILAECVVVAPAAVAARGRHCRRARSRGDSGRCDHRLGAFRTDLIGSTFA